MRRTPTRTPTRATTRATTRARILLALACLAALSVAGGCDAIRDGVAKVVGAPTSAEVKATAAQLAKADEEIEKLDEQRAAAAREQTKLNAANDRIAQRREVLERMQAELAAKLATAPPEARQILLASIRETDAQLEGLTNESAAVARLLADYEDQLVRVDVAAAKAKRDLAEHEATLGAFDEATAAAVKRTTVAVKGIGEQVGNLGVPGAGMVAGQISGILETGLAALLGGGSIGTVVAVRARRKAKAIESERDEAVEERDGARRVIAVTERFGIENIATDPNVRKQAKAALAGDEVARREFALAKAEA